MPVRARPKMLKRVNRKVKPPRRSLGPRSRLRKSLTTPFSWMRSSTKECSRRFQRFSVSPEQFSVRSLRLVDPLLEPSSKICIRKVSSSQSDSNTLLSISIKEAVPRQPLKRLLMKLLLKLQKRRSEG